MLDPRTWIAAPPMRTSQRAANGSNAVGATTSTSTVVASTRPVAASISFASRSPRERAVIQCASVDSICASRRVSLRSRPNG
jgi:hypothetical protein